MQSITPTKKTQSNSIFLLNPLTVYFLSGFALELFVFSCDQDHKDSDKRSNNTTYESNIRMNRWVGVFKKYCVNLFKSYSEEYERNLLQNTDSPHQLHSKLLIGATQKMLQAIKEGHVKDKATFSKIKSWLELITSIEGTSLRKIFEGENQASLNILFDKLRKKCEQGVNLNSENFNTKIYCHFSPHALFMRLSFVVFIHNSMFSDSAEYKMWESQNSNFMSNLLCISEYQQVLNKSDIHHFVPSFPYIHHLPCRVLYNLWTGQDQLNRPVPVYDIFDNIVQCMHGKMTTYEQMNEKMSDGDNESIYAFYNIMAEGKDLMDAEKKKVISCEKQRRLQQNKKRKRDSEKKKTHSLQTWLFNFLFSSKYFIPVGIDWGNDTLDCAN